MEWQNNATNHDLDAGWASSQEHSIRRGYAWVGVSAFQAGIHTPVVGLKAWNHARYGTLDVTDGGTILNDALSFDIFSQAAMAVKSPNGMVDPLGGLHVERIFGISASQSSNNGLVSYTTRSIRRPVFSTPSYQSSAQRGRFGPISTSRSSGYGRKPRPRELRLRVGSRTRTTSADGRSQARPTTTGTCVK